MATRDAALQQTETYYNRSVTADIVQQGTGNAARDINHVGRDVNNITNIVNNPPPKPAPSSTVPFRRDDDFVPRDSLDKIQQICSKPAGRAALVGLGGVGKSQIAIEYAYRLRDASPTTWTFWVHAGTQARFEEGYRRIAEATKMDGWDDPKVDVLRLVRRWLCDESNGRWSMVVDNADDADVFFSPPQTSHAANGASQASELLSDFLPQSPNGSILVTSRSQDIAYRLTGSLASVFDVKPMEESDALVLLQKKLSAAGADVVADTAKELLEALDYMPLAITQAAAYITQRSPRMTVARYLDDVRTSDRNRARLLERDVGDSRRDGRASNSIIMTWQVSFEHIRRAMPAAARLLSLMSLFDHQGIPESLLWDQYGTDEGQERADFDDDVYTLTSYSLVEISDANGSEFEMHRLVQYSTKKWLELSGELEGWKARYAVLMDSHYPIGPYENWTVCRALFPHAQAAVHCRPEEAKALEPWASMLSKAASCATAMGQYNAAKEMNQSALEAREKVLGPEHLDTLMSLSNVAWALYKQGKYNEAEAMNRQTLAQREKLLGYMHSDTLASLSQLAWVLNSQGKYNEAEAMNQEALVQREKILGREHPDTLVSMASLASTYWNQGRWREAEELQVEVVQTQMRVLGDKHPETLMSKENLAGTYWHQGRRSEAEKLNMEVMQTRKKLLGNEHPDTLRSIGNLAVTYWHQKRWREAEELQTEVIQTQMRVLGDKHPETVRCKHELACILHSQARREQALALMETCFDVRKQVLGEQHRDTQLSLYRLRSWQAEDGNENS